MQPSLAVLTPVDRPDAPVQTSILDHARIAGEQTGRAPQGGW